MQNKGLYAGRFVLFGDLPSTGGMSASITRALDVETRLDCALKRFSAQLDDLDRLAFEREVDALSRLVHPNIVRMLGWGRADDLDELWIAEELLSEDLVSRCKTHGFESHSAFYAQVGGPILDALSLAHAREILHRDLKPQNVMFSGDGSPKLIDFGISGRTNTTMVGRTLQDFKSVPFSPPESALGSRYDETRDVFGFAALAVYALTGGGKLESYEELQARYKKLDLAPDLRDLIGACIATDPEDRPHNIVVARAAFERLCAKPPLTSVNAPRQRIGLTLSQAMLAQVHRQLGPDENLHSVCEMLNGEVVYEFAFGGEGAAVRAVTPDFTFKLVNDARNPSCLFIAGVFETRPAHWAQLVGMGFRLPIEFWPIDGYSIVQGGADAIERLMQGVEEHQALMASNGKSVLDVWRTILRGRIDLARALHPRLVADVVGRDRTRLFLKTDTEASGLEGLHYLVGDGHEKFASGEIERSGEGQLTLYSRAELPREIPRRVILTFNSIGTESAIRREERAINQIQDGDIQLPQLKALLDDPSKTQIPMPIAIQTVLPDLDDDKRQAVEAAIGSSEILLVIGPPGTGKTQFIAELVLQELKRKPTTRILIAAQTHIAVDNALKRVRTADGALKCIRIGTVGDDRISEASRALLLDATVTEWVARVTASSTQALRAMCKEAGIEFESIQTTVKHRQLQERVRVRDKALLLQETIGKEIGKVSASIDDAPEAPWRTELTRLQHELIGAKEVVRIANLAVEEAELAVATLATKAKDQVGSHTRLDDSDDRISKMLEIAELHEQWLTRLAVPNEHYPAVLMDANVVAGTCVGFVGAKGASQLSFDLAIVDEASRAAPTEVLVAASRAARIVLVGDRKQLPAYLDRGLLDNDWLDSCGLTRAEVKETLFERLETFLPSGNIKRLQKQYRMIPAIGRLVESCFYPGQLQHPRGEQEFDVRLTQCGLPRNVVLLSTAALSSSLEKANGTGFENPAEVALCERILHRIVRAKESFSRIPSIALLTPYVAQQKLLRRLVDQTLAEHLDAQLEAHTVHAFQGREADFAVVSLVRTNQEGDMGFVNDDQLLNVALSRGKGGLIIIGNLPFLSRQSPDSPIARVLAHLQSNKNECATLGLSSEH